MPETDTPTLTSAEPTQTEEEPKVEGLSTTEVPEQTETPVEGEETQETEEQREPLSEGWDSHPDHLAVLETHGKESHAKGYQEAQSKFTADHAREMQKVRIEHDEDKVAVEKAAQSSTVVLKAVDALDKYITSLEEGGADPVKSRDELTRMLADNVEFAEAFNTSAKKAYEEVGASRGRTQTSALLLNGLNAEMTKELISFYEQVSLDVRDKENPLDFNGGVDKILKERDKLVRLDAEAEINKLATSRNGKEKVNATHEGDKTVVEVGGRSGAGMKKYLDMTGDERSKLTDEQRDRAIARG